MKLIQKLAKAKAEIKHTIITITAKEKSLIVQSI